MSRRLQRWNVSRCLKVGWSYVIWNLHRDPGSPEEDKDFHCWGIRLTMVELCERYPPSVTLLFNKLSTPLNDFNYCRICSVVPPNIQSYKSKVSKKHLLIQRFFLIFINFEQTHMQIPFTTIIKRLCKKCMFCKMCTCYSLKPMNGLHSCVCVCVQSSWWLTWTCTRRSHLHLCHPSGEYIELSDGKLTLRTNLIMHTQAHSII